MIKLETLGPLQVFMCRENSTAQTVFHIITDFTVHVTQQFPKKNSLPHFSVGVGTDKTFSQLLTGRMLAVSLKDLFQLLCFHLTTLVTPLRIGTNLLWKYLY